MSMVFPSLLCLGLCLSQSTWAQKGNLRPPHITALPGSTVPPKSHVTLLCQGPGQAEGYKISKVGSPEPMDKEEQITPRKTNTLSIAEMTTDQTGLYHCSYQRGGRWSQFSDPLQLVMTGAYEKPSLSSLAGTVVAPGENVKLQCFSKINYDVFILTKEGEDHITQNQSSAPQDRGRQTIFLLSPVSSTQAGTYRCYGAFRENPYVWSQPSDPLQLQVEGSSTQHRCSTAPAAWHPSLETQVRLSLAAVLLLAMVVLLAEAWCSRGGGPSVKSDEPPPQWTDKRRLWVTRRNSVLHQRSGAEAGGKPECGRMSMVPPSLLCLGLCLSQSTWAQKGNLRPPRITALPGSTVPWKGHVTLLCQGPGQAEGYKIAKVGSPEPTDKEEQIMPRKTNTLSIAEITTDKTGLYHCSYQRGGRWSQFSDPLQLVMTGAFAKPSLSSLAGTVAALGENVKLQCFSKINYDVFILTKDGDHITQNQSSAPQDRGRQTIFLLSPVSSTQAGTYRCYGAFRDNPYVWSQPSDPLQLQVEAPAAWHPSLETQVRLSLAALLLLAMVVLLAEAWCSRGGGPSVKSDEPPPQWTDKRRWLCLIQSTWAQKGNLRPPRITALPGFTVPCKGHVTLLCQVPGQAEGYKISKVGSPEPTDEEEQITPRKTNTLNITEITTDKTGLYHCSYQSGGRWSQFSDPLQLVMTGAYEKLSLSSLAGTVVAPGENVKLQCFSKINYDVFILTKEGEDHITQNQSSMPQDRGRQTIFLLNPVSSTQAGTYRCYGAFRENPYLWSQPSDPLQLQVEGTTESPSSTQPICSTAPSGDLASRGRLLGIWIGVPVAVGLLLLVFLIFLILYCLRKAKSNAARKERQPEAAGRANGQVSEAADPQEVTYSQVTCHVPHQGTAGAPSRVPRQTQSSEYVTLAFR
ncbi:hypothetical protein AB1E19_013825 [Capra hircus]